MHQYGDCLHTYIDATLQFFIRLSIFRHKNCYNGYVTDRILPQRRHGLLQSENDNNYVTSGMRRKTLTWMATVVLNTAEWQKWTPRCHSALLFLRLRCDLFCHFVSVQSPRKGLKYPEGF